MPVARPLSSESRIIAHLDLDCFYVQVEQRKQPHLRGLPTAVVQYNSWKGGGLIAVSYEARKYGVTRSMRGDEAKKICPEIQLVQVPVSRGKADLKLYRDAGSEVVSVLARKGTCERASIDEVYLDLTDAAEKMLEETPPEGSEMIDEEALRSHILGLHNEAECDVQDRVQKWLLRSNSDHRDKLLACGTIIVAELRKQVLKETEFTCSAGIAHNKMLAKIASAMHKPFQQTVVPLSCVKGLLDSLPVKKMKQLGGKLGSSLQSDLGVNTVGDLLKFPEMKLQERYGINTGTWLWNIARGISGEEVEQRLLPKSHGSGKTFPGLRALKTISSVQHWLDELCQELSERLQCDFDDNKRIAHTLTLHARAYVSNDSQSHKNFPSKSCPLRYGAAKIREDALNLFQSGLREFLALYKGNTQATLNGGWGVTGLSVSASKMVTIPSGTCSITKYFNGQRPSCAPEHSMGVLKVAPQSPSGCEIYSESNLEETSDGLVVEETESEYTAPLPRLDLQEGGKDPWANEDSACSPLMQIQACSTMKLSPDCSKSQQIDSSDEVRNRDGQCRDSSDEVRNRDGQCRDSSDEVRNRDGQCRDSSDKVRNRDGACSLDGLERKRNTLKNKGTPSILSFFSRDVPFNSRKAEDPKNVQDVEVLSCTGRGWSYKMDEIDPMVIQELPLEIQEEFRGWLRPPKRPNPGSRGSIISHYFLPSKST